MVTKMAKVFRVTIDFLIGESENAVLDKEKVEHINDIRKVDIGFNFILFYFI